MLKNPFLFELKACCTSWIISWVLLSTLDGGLKFLIKSFLYLWYNFALFAPRLSWKFSVTKEFLFLLFNFSYWSMSTSLTKVSLKFMQVNCSKVLNYESKFKILFCKTFWKKNILNFIPHESICAIEGRL